MIKNIIRILFILSFFTIFSSCIDKMSKNKYRGTRQIYNNLYVEYYEPFRGGAGIFSGSLRSAYLTDSVNLNFFLGTMEDDESFDFNIDSNHFRAIKYGLIEKKLSEKAMKHNIDTIIIDLKTKKRIK